MMALLRSYKGKSRRLAVSVAACVVLILLGLTPMAQADPLEFTSFATLKAEAVFSGMEGDMGFEQQPGGLGTLNNFEADLGLPEDHYSFRISATVRPLQHHLVRVFGSIPEFYSGNNVLSRDLITRAGTVYPAGTEVESDLRTGMFGFGYDLDFLVGPTWTGGLHGDLRYIDLLVRLKAPGVGAGLGDVISVDEVIACLGAHAEALMPFGCALAPGWIRAGAFVRMSYGITPNYFNYVDLSMGLKFDAITCPWFIVEGRVGYRHETFFHDQEGISGRVLRLKRNGILCSLGAAF